MDITEKDELKGRLRHTGRVSQGEGRRGRAKIETERAISCWAGETSTEGKTLMAEDKEAKREEARRRKV